MSATKRTAGGKTEYPIRKKKNFLNIQAAYQVHYYVEIKYLGSKIKIKRSKLRGILL